MPKNDRKGKPFSNNKSSKLKNHSSFGNDRNVSLQNTENIGRVITSTGSFYTVKREDGSEVNCVVKGKFRIAGMKTTNPVAVGDNVHFIRTENSEYCQIDYIFPRKNYIIRKSVNLSKSYSIVASNLDAVFLIVSCKNPKTDTMFIDRFLVTANAYNVPCNIIINKTDIWDTEAEDYARFLEKIYTQAGNEVFFTSIVTNQGIDGIKEQLKGKIVLFCGNSGVGKSSLINILCPDAGQKTAEISSLHHSGKHTTTFACMFENGDIRIIDTPGVKSFGVVDFKKEELALYFPEMKERLDGCKYYNCTHTHEPGCAIKQAAEKGEIPSERYNNYIKLFNADDIV